MSLPLLTSARRRSMLVALVLGVLLTAQHGVAWAAFTRTSGNSGNAWTTDTLDPPTGLTYSRPCTPAVSTPTYVGGSTATAASGTATLAKPAGTTSGDLLVAYSIITDDTADNNASTPSGWTQQIDQYWTGHGSNIRVFTKFAGGSEPGTYALSGYDTSDHGAAVLEVYRGVRTTGTVDASAAQTNGSSTSATAPSVTTSSGNTMLLTALVGIATTTMGTPSGSTARHSAVATTDVLAVYDQAAATAGATGTRAGTMGASRYSIGVTLALTPAPGAPDPTVSLHWTATADTYATGYFVVRSPGGGTSVPGRTTTGGSDTNATAATAYTYTVSSVYRNWNSVVASISVPAC